MPLALSLLTLIHCSPGTQIQSCPVGSQCIKLIILYLRFDTLHGIRGELNLQIRLQFFGDMNPFKDSSAGVQFFTSDTVPPHLHVTTVLGFVSALDNADDPEYHCTNLHFNCRE
jgi:hypothetical protein